MSKRKPTLICIDCKKPMYSVYINGSLWHTIEAPEFLDSLEVEAFRQNPHLYVYGASTPA